MTNLPLALIGGVVAVFLIAAGCDVPQDGLLGSSASLALLPVTASCWLPTIDI